MDQVQDTFTAKVTDVVNATTLTGEYQDQSLTLRLIGVAAPPEQYEESVVAVHREYLVDRSFTFQLDTQRQDEEGAYWVYLWYNDSTTYNAMLLQSGLCPLGDLSQNTALAQALTEDNQYAQEHFVGIYLDNFDPENYTYDQGTYDQILQTMRPQPLPEDALTAVMHTSMGDMTFLLFPQQAPKAGENFVTHAREGYYDGVTFHRVIQDFMIQGGNPGDGGESIWGEPFENEISQDLCNLRGALSMANAGPDTNGSQFFVVQAPPLTQEEVIQMVQGGYDLAKVKLYEDYGGAFWLDGDYTVFGTLLEGFDVLDAIAAVETDDGDEPLEDVVIQSIDIQGDLP